MFKNKSLSTQSVANMALASLLFFLMGTMVKLCHQLPIVQIVFFRGVIAMFLCLIQLRIEGISPWGEGNKRYLLLRGVFGTIALVLFFTTLHQIPFAEAVTIQYLSPIFTTFFTAYFLKEAFFKKQALFFLLAFFGVLFIQGLNFSGESLPYLLGLLAAFSSAGAYTCIRKINTTEHPLVIIFYFPLITIPFATPLTYYYWKAPTSLEWVYLVLVGVFVQAAQYFMTRSYQLAEGSVASIASYLGLIWAGLGGYFIFQENLDQSSFIGIAFILTGVLGNTFYRQWRLNSIK